MSKICFDWKQMHYFIQLSCSDKKHKLIDMSWGSICLDFKDAGRRH